MKSRDFSLFLCLLSIIAGVTVTVRGQQSGVQPEVARWVGALPMVFEPNLGQAAADAQFLSRYGEHTLLLTPREAILVLPLVSSLSQQSNRMLRIKLVGMQLHPRMYGFDELPGKSNYFIGKDAANWRTNIPQYARVKYKSVYRGIDLVFYGIEGELEYDFQVAVGADPTVIDLRIEGTDQMHVDGSGNLLLRFDGVTVRLKKPNVYQDVAGDRREIACIFDLRGKNHVGFKLDDYDRSLPLVIDPVLSYGVLISANNNTQAQGMAIDSSGNMYITGTTFATNYPTVAALQSTNHGTTNAFVTKLGPAGNTILYSTYLGGSQFDIGSAVAVDSGGNAYVTGTARSSDFPTTPGAFMTTCPGQGFCNTPFVAKIHPDGSLGYSTYTGGSNTSAAAIAVDLAGEASITGTTASNDLPIVNAFQPDYQGFVCTSCYNAFVQKLNAVGSALVYSTYFGLAGFGDVPQTSGRAIAVDNSGSAYVVGDTTQIPTMNPIQSSHLGGVSPNAFITKFSPDGGSLIYSTYLGGIPAFSSGDGDSATGAAVDTFGNIHVTGTTTSCGFPLSLNAFNIGCANPDDDQNVFVVTLNSVGSHILFSTFLHSGFPGGIAVDKRGNTYVTGSTRSDNFPLVNPIETTSQRTVSSNIITNSFVSELDLAGKLLFSTYLGGQNGSEPAGIAVDSQGRIYIAGTGSGDFPILHPILKELQPPCCYGIFAGRISPANVPQLSLSPRTSPVLSLRNVSSVPLKIGAITPSSNFLHGGDCGATLAPGTGCTLILEGAADGKTSGTVTISSNASTTPQKFVISKSPVGDSVGPLVTITPSILQFPLQFVGSRSVPQQFTVRNSGLQPSTLSNISTSGDFKETNNCPAVLVPASLCRISVAYKPSSVGSGFGVMGITHDQATDNGFLGGFGSASAINASTASLEFGSQFVGQAPLARIVNFTNATPYPATVTGISVSQGFAQTNTCTVPLPPHGSCRVAVTFNPPANLSLTGLLTAANFGPGGAQTVSLIGTGVLASDLSVSPFELDFFSQMLGSTGVQTVTLTNRGSQPMTGFKFSSNNSTFSQTNDCPSPLPVAASCTMNAMFKPKQSGPMAGILSIQHSGAGSPQIVRMTGIGITALFFSPSPLVFPQQAVGTANTNLTLGISNISASSVTLTSITVQGTDFTRGQNFCPTTLLRNVGCPVQIIFKPTATGLRTGTATIVASDSAQAHIVQLQGTGIGAGQGALTTTSLNFVAQAVGTTSVAQQVNLTNSGSGKLNLGQINPSPSFFLASSNCGTSLAAGSTCTISVRFAPTLAGILSGTMTVNDDGANAPHLVSLTGIGQ